MTIRDLTDEEKGWLKKGACPFCGRLTTEFEARARGGLATNYYCPCGAGFNLASFKGEYVAAELIAEPEKQPEPPKEHWCECEHPLSWHNDEGRCQAPLGSSEAELGTDCSCEQFVEAQGDTLENLGVDVL